MCVQVGISTTVQNLERIILNFNYLFSCCDQPTVLAADTFIYIIYRI